MEGFQSLAQGKIQKGIVVNTSKSGLIVKSDDKYVFIPASLSSLLRDDKWSDEEFETVLHRFLNKVVIFQLLQSGSMIFGSITDAVNQLKQSAQPLSFDDIHIGSVYEGYIEKICQYGIFVDTGNLTAFVHRTCLLNPGESPLDYYMPGNRIVVCVTGIDSTKGRISCEEYRPRRM